MIQLPPYISREAIQTRLQVIFPEGVAQRGYITREIAASTVFTMLYVGAVEGNNTYIGPVHVYRMTKEQAALSDVESRRQYAEKALNKNFQPAGVRWYADNTREPIRDETLREGFVQVGAVITLAGLPTTSSKPRYALQKEFAALFDPALIDEAFTEAIKTWQENNLSAAARTRLSLLGHTSKSADGRILITYPNGEARKISAGPSSDISKAVIEVFAHAFLENPAVLWLSTSDSKVAYMDDEIATAIGLKIQADKDLPDIILVDLGKKDPLLVFVEVVATDGSISDRRKIAIYTLTDAAGFKREQVAFVTAYHDRQSAGFKKTISNLAWNSFVWFLSEPDKIVYFKDGAVKIVDMIQ